MKVLIWIGSLRDGSFSSRIAQAVVGSAPNGFEFETADGRDLPLFNQDLDTDAKPRTVTQLLDQVSSADAMIFVTPEFNYGIPGTLKNAVDWASRPAFRSPLKNTPAVVISHSPAPTGGARAHTQLTSVLTGTLTPLLSSPSFTIAGVHEKFDESGVLVDEITQVRLIRVLEELKEWVESLAK